MSSRRRRGWGALVAAALVASGCGDDDPSGLTIVNRAEDEIVVVLAGAGDGDEEALGGAAPGEEIEIPGREDGDCLARPLVARTVEGAELGRLGPGLCLDIAVRWDVTPPAAG